MKKNILVKQVLGNDSATGTLVHTWKDTMLKPMTENALNADSAEPKSKMQTTDEFRYSGRCYCGTY